MASTSGHGESYAEMRARQRERHLHEATSYHAGRRVFLAGLLALGLFLSMGALAFRQATSEESARNVLGAGIAHITDLDRLLAQDLSSPPVSGDPTAVPLPGFPIDINLTQADIQGKSMAQVRTLVLDRASARVYNDGVHAFDRTGDQAVSRFSGVGLLTTMANQVTRDNHHRGTLALIVLVILTALAAGAVVLAAEEGRRLRLVANSVLAAGLAGLVLSGAAWLVVGSIGGDDPFEGGLRSLARAVIDVPFRDFAIVSAVGLAILLIGPVVSLASRPFVAEPNAEGDAAIDADDDFTAEFIDDQEDEADEHVGAGV